MVLAVAPEPARIAAAEEPESAAPAGTHRTLYLRGRPRAKDFVRYVRARAVEPPSQGELALLWQEAREVVRDLEHDERGAADDPEIVQLGPEYEPLLVEFLTDPLVRHGFNTVPTEVALVELDRLVVYQKHIDLTFVDELVRRIGPSPTPEEVFRFCLLRDHTHPPVRWSKVDDDRFVFVSPSNDLRFLGTMPMGPDNVRDYPPPGALVGVVGVGVGFGYNFVNAIRAGGRLVLHNGSHRAYALRRIGVTHVPCIVQHVSSRAELDVVAPSRVRRHPDRYLEDPRPSMLRDYFDPRLYTVMNVPRRLHTVTVKLQVEQDWVPAP